MIYEDINEGKGSDTQVKGISAIKAEGTCVLNGVEYEFARSPLGGPDNALVGQIV